MKLLGTAPAFPKRRTRRVSWSPTGGGNVADPAPHLDTERLRYLAHLEPRPSRQHAVHPSRRFPVALNRAATRRLLVTEPGVSKWKR